MSRDVRKQPSASATVRARSWTCGWWLVAASGHFLSVCLSRSLSCSLINRPSSLVSVLFKASPALKGELKYPLLLPGPFSLSPVISSWIVSLFLPAQQQQPWMSPSQNRPRSLRWRRRRRSLQEWVSQCWYSIYFERSQRRHEVENDAHLFSRLSCWLATVPF